MRRAFQAGSSGLVLALLLLMGSVVLWVAVPLAWLWVASQVVFHTGSLGAALAAAAVGFMASVAAVLAVLSWLNRLHGDLREARGLPSHGPVVLEAVLVVSAGLALVAFVIWFFLFSGAQPIPVTPI